MNVNPLPLGPSLLPREKAEGSRPPTAEQVCVEPSPNTVILVLSVSAGAGTRLLGSLEAHLLH